MANENYKPQIPDIMEAIFDTGYLIFDLIAGVLFFAFSKGNPLFILYGVLTLTLCGGDAFHLVPRIIRAVHGSNDKIKGWLAYDSKNLCIYVGHRNGTSALVLNNLKQFNIVYTTKGSRFLSLSLIFHLQVPSSLNVFFNAFSVGTIEAISTAH